jgi:hypothetical protein
MLNSGDKNPKGAQSIAVVPDTDFDDPLLHRAAGAMQIGLQAAMVKEGE